MTVVRLFGVLVVALAALLVLTAAPVSAKQIHTFSTSFGAPASDTTLSLTAGSGLAVNETSHDIYIADTGNRRIVELTAAGAFVRAFGADVGGAGVDVCTASCQPGNNGTSPGSFEMPTFLAIDNSGGASSGNVYVMDSATNVISKFKADGTLVSTWGNNGAFEAANGQLAGKTQAELFTGIAGIAIDSAGTLAVLETSSQLLTFTEGGSFIGEIAAPRGSAALGLSVDGDGNFFKANGDLTIQKFAPSGASIGQITAEAAQATGFASNPASGVLYADFGAFINAYAFNGAGEVINPAGSCAPQEFAGCPATERFAEGAFGQGGALAVDGSTDTVYAVDVSASSIAVFSSVTLPDVTTNSAEVLGTTTATLRGEVNPLEISLEECFFEYGETTDYGATASCEEPDAGQVGTGNSPVPVHASLGNLTPGATYHYRLVAGNSNGTNSESGDQEFFTGPSIVSTFVSGVSATAATLNTEINPHGSATTYRFQYVADSAFQLSGYAMAAEVPVGGEAIGSGTSTVARSRQLLGLTPSTTYHFRVLAVNALGVVEGPDLIFVTQSGDLGFRLPDGRVWEMVSPPDKHGALLVGVSPENSIQQASADGSGLAYESALSPEPYPQGNRNIEPSMNLAGRQADGSWRSKDITPPNENVTPITIGNGSEFKLFNSSLSEAIFEPRSGTPLSPEASERSPYLRQNREPPTYTPLVTDANVPPGTEFGGGQYKSTSEVEVTAVSLDFRHFGLVSRVPLVEGAPAAPEEALYEWSGGQFEPVSVLPSSEGGAIIPARFIGSGHFSVRGAISEDGARVFWSPGNNLGNVSTLYVRDTQAGESGRLDVKQVGASGSGPANPIFQGADADGRVVFFTDSQQLTENASSEGTDLYRCELPSDSVASGCASLTDVSVPTGAGESAEVQGIVAALSADGSEAYFVAKGVLDEASNKLGDSAVSGQPNLYVWRQGEGVRFIASLSGRDMADWGQWAVNDEIAGARALAATASPSGRYFGFMSQRSLTGYDNRDHLSNKAAQEVFRYDSTTERLECLSCNPTGARPHSAVPSQAFRAFGDPWHLWKEQMVAAALPEAPVTKFTGSSLYRPRAVLDNGRVFFNVIDSLVPADSNGQWDVYLYEPTGVGDCSSSPGGASISRAAGGCVSLISSGTAEEEAAFFDASETGDDAFFFTSAQLSVLDEDHEVDIYDARVDGVAATRPVKTECLGEACRGTAPAPSNSAPASSAFNGAGNVTPAHKKRCGKGKRRVRRSGKVRCVSRKHTHHGDKSRGAHR